MLVDCDFNTANELQRMISYTPAKKNFPMEMSLFEREHNNWTKIHRPSYERSRMLCFHSLRSSHRGRCHMSWTVDRCCTPSHPPNLQNIHRSLTCSWRKDRRPRNWNIVQSMMIHWEVVDWNESYNSIEIPRAVCPGRSNIVRLDFRTLVWIQPRIDWRNMNSIPPNRSVELILKIL